MMKTLLFICGLVLSTTVDTYAQKYFTKTANINFYSSTPLEDIDAKSNQVTSIIDFGTGDIVFKMQVKTFQFKKALMQEHFNEKYIESDKYPEATFNGKIDNYSAINPTKEGEYKVKVTGNLTIHGVTKSYTTDATITVKGGAVSAMAKFPVKVADHKIVIPGAVKDNIAETIDVTVSATYTPMAK